MSPCPCDPQETSAASTAEGATFLRLLEAKAEVFRRKNHDYAGRLGTYHNFEYAARVAEPFADPVDRVFATMVGIKMGRLAALTESGAAPNCESVQDTRSDLATYVAIWEAWAADRDAA